MQPKENREKMFRDVVIYAWEREIWIGKGCDDGGWIA